MPEAENSARAPFEDDLTLKTYDLLHQLLNRERIKNNLLRDRIKRLESHSCAPEYLISAAQMAVDIYKMGCDEYEAKYGDQALNWGNILQSAIIKATESEDE